MKKEIVYWFCSIVISILLMDLLLYFGYDSALYLSLVLFAFSYLFYRKGVERPLFSTLLCGGLSVGSFFLLILSIPLLVGSWYGNVFASSCAIISMYFAFFSFAFDGQIEDRPSRYEILNTSLSGYTEGDYRFPTNEELAEIHEHYSKRH